MYPSLLSRSSSSGLLLLGRENSLAERDHGQLCGGQLLVQGSWSQHHPGIILESCLDNFEVFCLYAFSMFRSKLVF